MTECITVLYLFISPDYKKSRSKLSQPNLECSAPLQNYTENAAHTFISSAHIL